MKQHKWSRKWLLTINNPKDHEYTAKKIKDIALKFENLKYWCMCDEIGSEKKTYHTHVYLHNKNPVRWDTIQKRYPKFDIRLARGTAEENRNYIRKEGKHKEDKKTITNLKETFFEEGELPIEQPGKRNDVDNLYQMIKSGMTNYDILEESSQYMYSQMQIDRTRQIIHQNKYKSTTRSLNVNYWYGDTASGKSETLWKLYNDKCYVVTDYKNPFDSYQGQAVVCFDEFHGQIDITEMLKLLDIYPCELRCRYMNKFACYLDVYIVSNIELEQQYIYEQEYKKETWNAFKRRIHEVREFKHDPQYNKKSLVVDTKDLNNDDSSGLPF